jgi:DNA-binding NarL/FixJ family response regulator
MTIRVLLADDHEIMRQGLRAVLEGQHDVEVVGEASSGREAVKKATKLQPDLVIMDVSMTDLNGIEATRQIKAESPRTKVLGLSGYADSRSVAAMLRAGASGYVLKSEAYHDLRAAIDAALAGKSYLAAELAGQVADIIRKTGPDAGSVYDVLGPREREVLQLLAEGLSSVNIAHRLHISTSTVETHRRNLMRKLGIHTVAELTKFAIREGLTSTD